MKNTAIYGIRNVIDNKIYIGSTKNYKTRKYNHFYELKRGRHGNQYLQRAYDKHGKDKFHMFLLEECELEKRIEREVYYIKEYNSFKPEFGYNIYEPNGDNFKCSEDTVEKLIRANIDNGRSIPIDVYHNHDLNFYKSFDSISACSKEMNIKPSTHIFDIIEGKNNRLSFKGFTFFRKGEIPYARKSSKQRDMTKFRNG